MGVLTEVTVFVEVTVLVVVVTFAVVDPLRAMYAPAATITTTKATARPAVVVLTAFLSNFIFGSRGNPMRYIVRRSIQRVDIDIDMKYIVTMINHRII